MKFWEALKALHEDGAKIRKRSIHDKNEYFYWDHEENGVARKYGPDWADVDFICDECLNFYEDKEDDWEIVKEPHNFQWAINKLKEGRKVKRSVWIRWSIYMEDDVFMVNATTIFHGFSLEDIEANDWELVE